MRLRGGTKKGVHRLLFDDDSTAVAYVRSADEDYWDAGPTDLRAPFSHSTGLALRTAAHERLARAGVRTPRLLYADATRAHLAADAAVVEDVRGGSLEEALRRDPRAADATLRRLADELAALHAQQGPAFGKVALVDNGGLPKDGSCERVVMDRALHGIEEIAAREPRAAAAARSELADAVRSLAAAVRPRARHTLVHGELGLDQVLVTPDGDPVLIDVEGLMYFDIEWEHVFLRLRFGPDYDALRVPGLDKNRLRLYRLAMHLSLVAGPLRLLDGDFPDRAPMRAIAEWNLLRALDLVGRRSYGSFPAGGHGGGRHGPGRDRRRGGRQGLDAAVGQAQGAAAEAVGSGSLLAAAGIGLFAFLGPLREPHPSLDVLPVIGWCGFMGGLFLQNLILRPGRRGGDAAAKTSS